MLDDEGVETIFSCALEILIRGEFAAEVATLFDRECVHAGLDPEETQSAAALANLIDADGTHEFFRAWIEAKSS